MENCNDPHPDYFKGFNEGYLISERAPEIGNLISKYLSDTERGQGFLAGSKQFQSEKMKDKIPDWLKGKDDDFGNEKYNSEPSKDDFEIER